MEEPPVGERLRDKPMLVLILQEEYLVRTLIPPVRTLTRG